MDRAVKTDSKFFCAAKPKYQKRQDNNNQMPSEYYELAQSIFNTPDRIPITHIAIVTVSAANTSVAEVD